MLNTLSQRGFLYYPAYNEIRREKDGFVLTDYNHMRLFISFLSNVLGEIKINFSLSIKKVLCLEADDVKLNGMEKNEITNSQ